jgi:hypothetical protein
VMDILELEFVYYINSSWNPFFAQNVVWGEDPDTLLCRRLDIVFPMFFLKNYGFPGSVETHMRHGLR